MADQNELRTLVADLVAKGEDRAVIDAVIARWDSAQPQGPQTSDTRPGGGIGTPHDNVPDAGRKPAKAEDFYKPNIFQQRPEASVVPGVIGAAKTLGGMAVGAVRGAFTSPSDMAQQDVAQRFMLGQKAQTAPTGFERGAYNIASYVPFLGPGVMSAVEKLGTADPEQMGSGLMEAAAIASMTAPKSTGALIDATAGRAIRAVPGVVERVVKSPAARMAADAAASYVPGHTGRVMKTLAKTITEDRAALPGQIADAVTKATKEKTPPKLPKEKQPRLTQPGLDTTIADELASRIDEAPQTQLLPPSDVPPGHLRSQGDDVSGISPTHVDARVADAMAHWDAQRPVEQTGGTLTDPQNAAALADELRARLDAQQGQGASVDPNALDAQTAAKLDEAQASPARGTARIGPDGKPVIEPAATEHTRPTEPPPVPPSPNAGGALTGERGSRPPTPTSEAVTQSLEELLTEQQQQGGARLSSVEPSDTQGQTDAGMGDALSHLFDMLKQQEANKAARTAPPAPPVPEPPPAAPAPGEVNLTMQGRPSAPPAPAAAASTLVEEVAGRGGGAQTTGPEPAPAKPTVHRSKTKSPTYSDNDLAAVKKKFGPGSLDDLRTEHGQDVVDGYMLEERAARAKATYEAKRDAAAAKKKK